jgi:hypothetical protein
MFRGRGGDKGPCSVEDRPIASASTKTALEAILDFMFGGIRVIAEKSIKSHDETGGAKAALTAIHLCNSLYIRIEKVTRENLLDRVGIFARANSFDGYDMLSIDYNKLLIRKEDAHRKRVVRDRN